MSTRVIAPRARYPHANRVTGVSFSPDGATFVTAAYDALVLRDVADGAERWRFGHGDIWCAVFTPRGDSILAGGYGSELLEIDAARGTVRRRFPESPQSVFSLAVSTDGSRVATGERPLLRVWDVATAAERASFAAGKASKHHTPTVSSVAFSPSGAHVAATCKRGVVVLATETGVVEYTATTDRFGSSAVAFVDDDTIMTGGTDATLALRSVAKKSNKKPVRVFPTACETLTALAVNVDRSLALSGGNGPVQLWSIETGACLAELGGVTHGDGVAFSPDGTLAAAAAGVDNEVCVWAL